MDLELLLTFPELNRTRHFCRAADALFVTALQSDYVYVDWGLSFALDHRRNFPDAPESATRVSHARIALEYLTSIGGSAYLPRRMIARELRLGALHAVDAAPVITRQAYASYPVRSPRLELIETALEMIRSDSPVQS